jgi:protein O-GlcNAc transferase
MNQDKLVSQLKSVKEYDVRLVSYEFRKMPFLDQVKISHNSDVFIGIHGAGLTHMIFQPDWGSVIELYNCSDASYGNLARLRGVKHFTWEKQEKMIQQDEGHHPQEGAHQKFTNYAFDETEFMRLVAMAVTHVRTNQDFIEARKLKFNSSRDFLNDEL